MKISMLVLLLTLTACSAPQRNAAMQAIGSGNIAITSEKSYIWEKKPKFVELRQNVYLPNGETLQRELTWDEYEFLETQEQMDIMAGKIKLNQQKQDTIYNNTNIRPEVINDYYKNQIIEGKYFPVQEEYLAL